MAFYDYRCVKCDKVFEVSHGMTESPEVKCPECGFESVKVPSVCGIVVRGGASHMRDSVIRQTDAKQDLIENYGVENVTPLGGQNFDSVYKDIKSQGTMVKDQMQEKMERNEAKKRVERREWARKAHKRVGARTRKAEEMKKKEAAKKRAISVSS